MQTIPQNGRMTAGSCPKLDAYASLCEGVKKAAAEIKAIGGMEQFQGPGEHFAAPRTASGESPLTAREYLKRYTPMRDPDPKP